MRSGAAENSTGVARVLADQARWLAGVTAERLRQRHPELEPAADAEGRRRSERTVGEHVLRLADALTLGTPELFQDYAAWARSVAVREGAPPEWVAAALRCLDEVVGEELPDALAEPARSCLSAALAELPRLPLEPPTCLDDAGPLRAEAEAYLGALLAGRREEAVALVHAAVARGVPVRDLYLRVFQPVQREVGRLWQLGRCSVAHEHYCTAATQLVISTLYEHVFAAGRVGRTLVATCVGGELHELGIRMVSDFFEMEGWDTWYLGASTPTDAVAKMLAERQPDVFAISATMSQQVPAVRELVAAARDTTDHRRTRILVGGYPFNRAPDLWQRMHVDGCAPDARAAVDLAQRLLGAPGAEPGAA